MSNLASTATGAVTAFYDLLTAAGQAQSNPIPVFVGDVGQNEPNQYVLLGSTPNDEHSLIENHEMDVAALGSGAVYETYDIWGFATSWVGGPWDVIARMTEAWSIYTSVVMQTYINYWGGAGSIGGVGSQVLGASAPAALEEMRPISAQDASGPLGEGDGFYGVVIFGFSLKARLTIA